MPSKFRRKGRASALPAPKPRSEKQAEADRRRAEARALAAAERAAEREREEFAEVESLWDHIDSETQRIMTYIHQQIASGRRTSDEIQTLRETRTIHLRPILNRLGLVGEE